MFTMSFLELIYLDSGFCPDYKLLSITSFLLFVKMSKSCIILLELGFLIPSSCSSRRCGGCFAGFLRTLGVVERVHVSVDVALQIVVEARRRGEEGQTDGHELPASLETVVAEVLCGLSAELDVELVPQALAAPAPHCHLQSHGQRLAFAPPVAHVGLDEFEELHGLALHRPVRRHDHGLLDGLAAPRQHVRDGHLPPEQTLQDRGGGFL